ncbi:hypothetical protein SK128_020185 [Halocaridina rubra]|uniref:G-protein coupled receptors family 1 profile domain-containing protein n=1 Tax=Halocaridina rubra TaxID=373956 RepID=A0AAN8XKI3_HALRR
MELVTCASQHNDISSKHHNKSSSISSKQVSNEASTLPLQRSISLSSANVSSPTTGAIRERITFHLTTAMEASSTTTEKAFDYVYFERFSIPLCTNDNNSTMTLIKYAKCVSADKTNINVYCFQAEFSKPMCTPSKYHIYSFEKHLLNRPYRYYSLFLACATSALVYFDIHLTDFADVLYSKKYVLIRDESIVDLCLPLFEYFGHCFKNDYVTLCLDGTTMAFFLHNNCTPIPHQRMHLHRIMTQLLLSRDSAAFQTLCEGDLNAIVSQRNNVSFTLFPVGKKAQIYAGDKGVTMNKFWPCCYHNYLVLWDQNPKRAGLYRDWSYLPPKCQSGESALIVFQALVATFGLVGNFIVISVMLSGGHRSEASCFLRTSLSLADFLTSILVIVPAVRDSVALKNGNMNKRSYIFQNATNITLLMTELKILPSDLHHITFWRQNGTSKDSYFFTVDHDSVNWELTDAVLWELYPTLFNFFNGWIYVVRAHALCLCACVTIITMFFLGAERFILCWRPLKYKQYFTIKRVIVGILSSWLFGVVTLVVISYGKRMTVYWSGWTKLSYGVLDTDILFNKPLRFISIFLLCLGISTILFSVLALFAFLREQAKVTEERESMNMRITDDFEKENIYITISLVIISALYIMAYTPVGVSVISDHDQHYDTQQPILLFLSWWLLLAGSAVNPFIYNMRSHLFKSDMAECLQKILPEPLKINLKRYIKHSPNKMNNFLKDLDKRETDTGEPHNGLPKGSKLAALGLNFDHLTPTLKKTSNIISTLSSGGTHTRSIISTFRADVFLL